MVEKKKPKIKYKSKLLKEKSAKKSEHKKEHSGEHVKHAEKKEHHTEHHAKHQEHAEKKEHSEKHHAEHKSHEYKSVEHKSAKKVHKKRKLNVWAIVSLIELAILIFLLVYNPAKTNTGSGSVDTETGIFDNLGNVDSDADKKAQVDFYVMSYCPYGNQAEEFIYDVYKDMKDDVAFKPRYVIYTNYGGGTSDYCITDESDGKTYCSMHGIQELHQDIREMCVEKYFGIDDWFKFATAMNEKCNSGNADTCWEGVAKDLNLDVDKIKDCQDKEGLDLVKEQYELDQKNGVSGSPTIFVNGEPYRGARSAVSMMKVLCNLDSLKDSEVCQELPACAADSDCPVKEGMIAKCENPGTENAECVYTEDARVELIVVNDDECTICDTSSIMSVNKRYFPNLVVKEVEADSDEGKELIEKYKIEHLPAYIFSENITKTNAWQTQGLSRFFVHVEDKYLLTDQAIGSTWPADPEKRQEYLDLLENYADHNLEALNYSSDKPRLDYFVMAFCPYGNPAEEAAEKVYSLLGDKVEIVPHYILDVKGTTLSSLHGTQEANQDVRELCALELFGMRKFFDFVLQANKECSSSNVDSCWKGAAENAGFTSDEINQIEQCFNDRKLEIAKEQSDLNNQLYTLRGTSLVPPLASPTFLINGATYSGSRDANAIKDALCALFDASERPAECDETIESSTNAASSGGSC